MIPKGRLVIIGGSQAGDLRTEKPCSPHFSCEEIFQLISKNTSNRIELISSSKSSIEKYSGLLVEAGYSNFDYIHIHENQPLNENFHERLSKADTIFFLDDIPDIREMLNSSSILDLLYRKFLLESNFTIAGIGAGGMCLSKLIIKNDGTGEGLGFVNNCIIDTQFDYKSRFKSLVRTVILNNDCLGLGLTEGMVLIIEQGSDVYCKGKGSVMLVNARNVSKDRIKAVEKGSSIFVKNLKGHILTDGSRLNLMNAEVMQKKLSLA